MPGSTSDYIANQIRNLSPEERAHLQELIYGEPDEHQSYYEEGAYGNAVDAQDAKGRGSAVRPKQENPLLGLGKDAAKNYGEGKLKDYIFGSSESGAAGYGASNAGAAANMTPIGNGLSTPVTSADYAAIQGGGADAAAGASPLLQYGAGGLATLYGGYQLANHWGQDNWKQGAMDGATMGAGIGTMINPGLGTVIGGALGAVGGAALGSIKVGKHKDQVKRDAVRDYMIQAGILNPDYSLDLANGKKGDMGVDGGFKYKNVDGGERAAYETDTSNPFTHQAIGWANPLAELVAKGDDKVRSDLAGQMVNLATKDANSLEEVRANMKAIFARYGASTDEATQFLDMVHKNGGMSDDEFNSAVYGLGTLMSGKYNPNEKPSNKNDAGQQAEPTFQQPVPMRPSSPDPGFNKPPPFALPPNLQGQPPQTLPYYPKPGETIPGFNGPALPPPTNGPSNFNDLVARFPAGQVEPNSTWHDGQGPAFYKAQATNRMTQPARRR